MPCAVNSERSDPPTPDKRLRGDLSFHLLSFHPLQVTICPRFASATGITTAAATSSAAATIRADHILCIYMVW